MPVSTLRTWVLGLIFAIIMPGLNQFFFFRYPSVQINGIAAQLLIFPLGRAAAAFIPNWTIFGVRLNPGPFTVKEHVLCTVRFSSGIDNYHSLTMFSFYSRLWHVLNYIPLFYIYWLFQATVGIGSAYATDIVAVQRVYYNQIYNFSCQFFPNCFTWTFRIIIF